MKKNNGLTALINEKVAFSVKDAQKPIVIGFSGGADSSALLYSLISCISKSDIICVHVNHMIRGSEADLDESHCKKVCENLGVKFLSFKIDVPAMAKSKSLEEAAREARYETFKNVCKEYNCKTVALAHNKSDNLETVIFNLIRGTGLNGLKGIPSTRDGDGYEIIRPLIDVSKEEIIGYCKENSIEFVYDKTNSDTEYTRNYIRHIIVPEMKKINPEVEDAVARMSKTVSRDAEFIDSLADIYISENTKDGKLNIKNFQSLNPSVSSRVVFRFCNLKSLTEYHIVSICESCLKNENSCICLPGKHYAYVSSGYLEIKDEYTPSENTRCIFSYKLEEKTYPEGFAVSFSDVDLPGFNKIGFAKISKCDIEKICIRSYRSSDKYPFYKMTRSIKKTSGGLDAKIRNIRPVFTLNDGVIWYPGYPVSDNYIPEPEYVNVWYFEQKQ